MAEDNIQDLCKSGPNLFNNKIDWIFKIIYEEQLLLFTLPLSHALMHFEGFSIISPFAKEMLWVYANAKN